MTVGNEKIKKLGFWEVASIGVGGMVGGGIFAVLGLSVQLSGGGAPLAFLIAGLVALVSSYSYARLSVSFPSQGGTVTFLDRAFGSGLLTGSANILLWLSYMVMLSLYAYAFGSYGVTFFPTAQILWKHVLITGCVVGITGLNLLSTKLVGEAEDYIVLLKLLILGLFIGVGFSGIHTENLAPSTWASPLSLVAGGMIIFLAYEGFELIANTAQDVRDARRVLPRAFYVSVGFVIVLYICVAVVTVGTLPLSNILTAKDYALAEAAKPSLGQAGFTLIAIAAMLSTASAVNATIYGAARLSYVIAKDGELPEILEKKAWDKPLLGLLITAGVTIVLANLVDLSAISTMGSAGFLLIFAFVNLANVKLARQTQSRAWISLLGALLCLAALGALLYQISVTAPQQLWFLCGMLVLAFSVELLFRLISKRTVYFRDLKGTKVD
ncbi:amino acid permease [Desulfobulbus rhabdoformis]|uniref:APC family permease n=1 Tax=Desulfobulbus rhabdoformis TaxID=34032 RepID=UPI001965C24D|nr:APC family permease [Desulfobulbus rhabdoformis]MBM9616520.1 amino acid permease [Desulfobulbus rhabdoformis]